MRLKDVLVGGAMTAAGIAYLRMVMVLPSHEGADATTVPTILAWMMIALGLIELVRALRRPPAEGQAGPQGGLVTVALTLALITGFIAALRPLGFPLATALYLFLQFIVLTPRAERTPVGLYAVLSVTAAAVIFATFRYGFDLLLPSGPLVAWLN